VTVVLPASTTVPIPLLIVAETAWFDVHVKVALCPTVTVAGEAANVTVGAADVGGVAADVPHPLNQPVVKLKTRDSNN
jgi:hypothetical protein